MNWYLIRLNGWIDQTLLLTGEDFIHLIHERISPWGSSEPDFRSKLDKDDAIKEGEGG